MKILKIWLIKFSFLLCSYAIITVEQISATAQLMGVYNMLTKESNEPSSEPPDVRFNGSPKRITGKPYVGKPQTLPVDVLVTFQAKNLDEEGKPQPYIIKIEENPQCGITCPPDKICISAKVVGFEKAFSDATQNTCVSQSVFFLKKGDKAFQWQNVMLFLADQDETGTRKLPFKFGIGAWTAISGIWNNDFIDSAPKDPYTNAPVVQFEKKPTTFRGKEINAGLRVLQGQPAWGGGPVPRAYHLHIAHIFNNTGNALMVRRNVPGTLASYNFEKIIPARSVAPFTFVWLPKLTKAESEQIKTSPVHVFVWKKTRRGPLPPAFGEITEIEGTETETDITNADIESAVDSIIQNNSTTARELAGFDTIIDNLKKDPDEIYIKGVNSYKLFSISGPTTNDPQTVSIKRVPSGSTIEEEIYTHTDPAYKGVNPRKYLRIIVDEATPEQTEKTNDAITFKIDDISEESVYEKSEVYN